MRPAAMVEVAAAAACEQQARTAAHGLAHAQLEHAGGVAHLALAGDDDHVGAVEIGDARGIRRERVPVARSVKPVLTSAPPPAARTSSAQAQASSLRLLARGHDRDRLGAVQARVMAEAARDRLGELLGASRARARGAPRTRPCR